VAYRKAEETGRRRRRRRRRRRGPKREQETKTTTKIAKAVEENARKKLVKSHVYRQKIVQGKKSKFSYE
jgi:stalled ribosome alternative rescue factor ArfA